MEDVSRAAGALLPPDFGEWPKPARRFLRALVNLPTWREHGFALCTDDQIAEWFDASDRSVRRWLKVATERGEVARVFVRRGSELPDGKPAARGLSILVAGDAQRARRGGDVLDVAGRNGRAERTERPREPDKLTGDRSIDLFNLNQIDQAPRFGQDAPRTSEAPRARPLTRSTFVDSREEKKPSDPGDDRAAYAIASHYAKATAKRWRFIHPDILALVVSFVAEMNGDEEDKVRRACAVVDLVIAQQRAAGAGDPTPRFIFHRQIFWKHLERVSGHHVDENPSPAPKPSPSPLPPPVSSTTPKPSAPATAPANADADRVDPATVAAFVAQLEAESPPAPPVPKRADVGRWVEPPACHDPSCGECERCTKRAPLSRALFRDMREAARLPEALEAFEREANEARERELIARRDEQLRKVQEWIEQERVEAIEPPRVRLPLAATDEREEIRLALEEFEALGPPDTARAA